MGRITLELLRKRSEHNEGEISTLEELALHQEKIIRIENLDKWCRHLKVLLLQNNSITKLGTLKMICTYTLHKLTNFRLENLSRLKCLEYLNLAMNNIEVIEGLEGCESLKKLDLTLNFIGQISSVAKLSSNYFLEELYLTGNPCVEYVGYREFVVSNVPQLMSLDGTDVIQTERIVARQTLPEIRPNVRQSEGKHSVKREIEKRMDLPDINDENFWHTPSPDTPEVRAQIQRKIEDEEAKKRGDPPKATPKPPRKLFDDKGCPYNINEGKYEFSMRDEEKVGLVEVEIKIPKYMDTSLVNLDIQPTYVRAVIKTKIFQLALPEEVKSDQSIAQRSQTTGSLVISMPKLSHHGPISVPNAGKSTGSSKLTSKIEPLLPVKFSERKNVEKTSCPGTYLGNCHSVDESEVPPLI